MFRWAPLFSRLNMFTFYMQFTSFFQWRHGQSAANQMENVSTGFLPEVNRILTKYGLYSVLIKYVTQGTFPSKCAWKKMVKVSTTNAFVLEWNCRTSVDTFRRFRVMHKHFEVSFLWKFTKANTKFTAITKVIAQLIAYLVRYDDQCCRCDLRHSSNFTDHLLLDCTYVSGIRNAMYRKLSADFGALFLQAIESLPKYELVHTLLGLWHPLLEHSLRDSQCYNKFTCTVYRFIYEMYLKYP